MPLSNPIPPIPEIPFSADLAQPLSFGPASPLVLLPVRLETRFAPLANGAELRVRVYPDKIHVDTHEPELTAQELAWGTHFWEQTWRAGDDDAARKLAWRQLAERFDANRAAWIARALTPLNPGDRPKPPPPADKPLQPPISFPSTQSRADAWTRAPLTRVLPKRWFVFGYAGGALAVRGAGNPIPNELVTGPSPAAPERTFSDTELAIDAEMQWMVDFAEAEKVGMGIRLRLTVDQAQRGFDFLLVFGTRFAPDQTDGAADLAALLDAHHYTEGLSFVPQGTPSNNTPDAPSGFSSADPGEEASYGAERATAAFRQGDGSNADVLAAAFGLRDERARALANVGNASSHEQDDARHMNRALWPATLGYFLTQMIGAPLKPEDIAWGRAHFVDYVRAAGPLPTLRVGRQPYGILPVTALGAWKPKAGQEAQFARDAALRDFLLRLRGVWQENLQQAPRVGRTGNPDTDVAEIFALDAISSSYGVRHLAGEGYLRSLWSSLVAGDQKFWWIKQQELARAALGRVGLNWSPRLASATYTGWQRAFTGPLVQAEPPAEGAPLTPNYLALLLNEGEITNLQRETFGGPKPTALLYALLRHALLHEYWRAALSLIPSLPNALVGSPIYLEREIVEGGPVTPTVWELLNRPAPGIVGSTFWRFLFELSAPPPDPQVASGVAPLLELRESIGYLQNVSAANLQRLLAGSLDLCSHRLDAWITSFATKRLAELRKASPTGLILGGYGWVVNLRPAAPATRETPPAGQAGEFFLFDNNPGFTHTPSLAQAATVAVLRSGHLSHANGAAADLLAVDLSSERVRLAQWLLDGVRQGQPLAALLGYRFERRLQELRVGQFASFFREVAPLVAKKLEAAQGLSAESIAANNVVDGLALQRAWKTAKVALTPGGPLMSLFARLAKRPDPARLRDAQDRLVAALNMLDDSVDAVGDALLAESVHQAVQGNPQRTASTLDAIASGEAPPPELDVVRTPRTGSALTHRLVVLLQSPPATPKGWQPPSIPYRADAEPHLNAWAAGLLGSAANVRCAVERLDPATAAVLETKELRLSELRLAPLDYIYAAEGSREAPASEIERRILFALMRNPNGFPPDATLRINPRRRPGWAASELSYGEFSELVRTARRLITAARGIDGSELNLPEANQPASVDLAELVARADKAENLLRQLQNTLRGPVGTTGGATLDPLRTTILRATHFGITGAIPSSPIGEGPADRAALVLQAGSVLREITQRVERAAAIKAGAAANPSADDQRALQVARLRALFGDSFVVLPRFSAANAPELERALADSTLIQDGDPLAAVVWLQRVSRVRDGVGRLDAVLRYAEALGSERVNVRLAQLPYREGDRWVGLPLKPGAPLSASRFSLAVQTPPTIDVKLPLAGVLIDEWVEVVPSQVETTGLVFQYDQPNAAPPQSILVAVPPDPDQAWNLWSLQQVLLETLDLARLRAVDPESLDELGQYLPALYFAVNDAGDTVSTDFST